MKFNEDTLTLNQGVKGSSPLWCTLGALKKKAPRFFMPWENGVELGRIVLYYRHYYRQAARFLFDGIYNFAQVLKAGGLISVLGEIIIRMPDQGRLVLAVSGCLFELVCICVAGRIRNLA